MPCPSAKIVAVSYRPTIRLLTNASLSHAGSAARPQALPRQEQARSIEVMLRVRDELLCRIVDGTMARDQFSHKVDTRGRRVVMVELARMLGLDPIYVRALVASARRVRAQLKAGIDAA